MEHLHGLKEYFRQLERALTCPRAQRRLFLAEVQRMAEDFLQGNPDATPEEVMAFLGPPRQLAHTFLETLPPEEVRQYQRRRKHFRLAGVLLAVAIVVSACIVSAYVLSRPMNVQVTNYLVIYKAEERP